MINQDGSPDIHLNLEETLLVFSCLKKNEAALDFSARQLLFKMEKFLYEYASIDMLETYVGGNRE